MISGVNVSNMLMEICQLDAERRPKFGINAIGIHYEQYYEYCKFLKSMMVTEDKEVITYDEVDMKTPWGHIRVFPQKQFNPTIFLFWDALISDLQRESQKPQVKEVLPPPEDFVISKGPISDKCPPDSSPSQ